MSTNLRDHLQFLFFLALLLLCSVAPAGCCTAEPSSADSSVSSDSTPSAPEPDGSSPPDCAVTSPTPDAMADGPADGTPGWSRCGECWEALGFDDATCASLGAATTPGMSGYRTCGGCVEVYTFAECAMAPLLPVTP
jgi:hypothetical protein